ncbi:hypothetical protein DIPPA_06903 [Diplonema papillatum]|nr:hypothetical protein DIPPA_06903 [Diplonema papillatum]
MPKNSSKPWIKNHPLEGDGLLTGFYDHMWKKNKEFKSCEEVLCPDTIVYDHNFPRGWYAYDKKNKELIKKQGKELDTSSIYSAFSKSDHDVGIVASYMHSFEDPDSGEPVTHVEFFNKEGLAEFVNRKVKKEGILQRFLAPKGRNNSVIQAVWSPRVCIVQRKTNVKPLYSRAEAGKNPYSCAVTYEGPSHYSEDGTCAAKTTAHIKQICCNIVDHFYNTEHKHITRMVLYFKVDRANDVWLLWCGSIRVSDRSQPSKMPLNLSPIFTSPTANTTSTRHGNVLSYSEDDLPDLDKSHAKMACDPMFFKSYVASPKSHSPGRSTRPGDRSRMQDDGQKDRDDDVQDELERLIRKVDQEDIERNWFRVHGIEDKYKQLCLEREVVTQVIADTFYEAYSHFLRHDTGPFYFDFDKRMAQIMTPEALQEMMSSLKIEHAPPPDDPNAVYDEELSYWIPNDHNRGPVTKLSEMASKWVQQFYDKKEKALREEAASIRKKGEDAPANVDSDQANSKSMPREIDSVMPAENKEIEREAVENGAKPAEEDQTQDDGELEEAAAKQQAIEEHEKSAKEQEDAAVQDGVEE